MRGWDRDEPSIMSPTVPWRRILDVVLGVADVAGLARSPMAGPETRLTGTRALGHLEARLTGVVVAALKEAFDRDARRLDFEREQIEAERARAERALGLELRRQAGEREIGRLRLLAGLAVVSFLSTLFFVTRLASATVARRAVIGIGWALLLAALAAAFAGQSRIADALARLETADLDRAPITGGMSGAITSGIGGAITPWLAVAGLAFIAFAVIL
jgi:hypothetical protein